MPAFFIVLGINLGLAIFAPCRPVQSSPVASCKFDPRDRRGGVAQTGCLNINRSLALKKTGLAHPLHSHNNGDY